MNMITALENQRVDHNLWPMMQSGRLNIDKVAPDLQVPCCQQYLYSYMPKIRDEWNHVGSTLNGGMLPGNLQIIDYACGAGLATAFWCNTLQQHSLLKNVRNITLLEQVSITLTFAQEIADCSFPGVKVNAVCKPLDAVQANEMLLKEDAAKIHLFSNILDMATFDIQLLLDKALKCSGRHIFIAVGHDRNFEGGTPRLNEAYDYLVDKGGTLDSRQERFITPGNKPAAWFYVDLKI